MIFCLLVKEMSLYQNCNVIAEGTKASGWIYNLEFRLS